MKNRKGFTLIELLAVITILGILMIVAIPAVSRTIENSRRNTFLSTAKTYANAAKTAFASDEVKCVVGSDNARSANNLTKGMSFWIPINTDQSKPAIPASYAYDNAKELVNQGGLSSWGNANVSGWVVGVVDEVEYTTANGKGKRQDVTYYVELIDENARGISFPSSVVSGKTVIQTTNSGTETTTQTACTATSCTVLGTLAQADKLQRNDVKTSGAIRHVKSGITGASDANSYLCYLG